MTVLYAARGSAVETLDPRAKILAAVIVAAALVAGSSVLVKGAIVVLLVAAWAVARLSTRVLAVTVASLSFFFVVTLVLRAVLRPPGGGATTALGPVVVSHAGLVDAAQMCLQILGIVLSLSLLVRSTPPVEFAEGLERLLRPFARLGAPVHEGVLMFSIALRFLPIMSQEFGRLQIAQAARGGALVRGNVLVRAKGVVPLLVPLFMVTLLRARDLSEAMEARGYRGAVGRSEIRTYRYGVGDGVVLALAVAALAAAIAVR